MQTLPTSARLYVWGIILGGAIMLLLLTPSIPFGHLEPMIASAFLILMILLADVYRIQLPFKAEVSVSMSVAFATLLLFGPGLACWAAAIGDCLRPISKNHGTKHFSILQTLFCQLDWPGWFTNLLMMAASFR